MESAREGKPFVSPVYDSNQGTSSDTRLIPASPILICDGEIAAHTAMRDEFDGLILVETHWRTQLDARLNRDRKARNFSVEKAIPVFLQSNLRDSPRFAEGAFEAADIAIYRNRRNDFVLRKLRER